jgi:hypothetical protein
MTVDVVTSICAEFDIEIVPPNVYPKPGQTRCLATMSQIMKNHGEGHLRLVVATLAETRGNQGLMTEVSLWAVSDLVRACAGWIEDNASQWMEAWDAIPMGWLMWRCQELVPIIMQRHALVGMMYLLLTDPRAKTISADRQPDYGFMRRVMNAENEPTPLESRRREMIAAGQRLLNVKASLPRGEFLRWVQAQPGMTYNTVQRYMKMAKAA